MTEVGGPQRAAAKRRTDLFGTVAGTVAAGVAAGVAAERALIRRTRRGAADPYAGEPFGQQPCDEARTVTTVDGTELYVEIVEPVGRGLDAGPPGAAAPRTPSPRFTVVFVHGFCLDMGTFYFQRKALARRGDYRMVCYDQPGHGRSGRLVAGEYQLPALGEALRAVLDATVPAGPAVLVGHSMGGMVIMAFAERYPQYFGAAGKPTVGLSGAAGKPTVGLSGAAGKPTVGLSGAAGKPTSGPSDNRVVGVVLLATSGGRLEEVKFGLPSIVSRLGQPLLPLVNGATRVTGGVVDRARQVSSDLAWLLTRRYGFGTARPSPALVSFVEQMNSRTSAETIARYLRTLYTHARYPALAALRNTPVLLICGARDVITPVARSAEILRHLPGAEMVTVADSGHVVMLEHPDEVNTALVTFLEKIN